MITTLYILGGWCAASGFTASLYVFVRMRFTVREDDDLEQMMFLATYNLEFA